LLGLTTCHQIVPRDARAINEVSAIQHTMVSNLKALRLVCQLQISELETVHSYIQNCISSNERKTLDACYSVPSRQSRHKTHEEWDEFIGRLNVRNSVSIIDIPKNLDCNASLGLAGEKT
jgi:hypothetical protein